MNEEEFDALTKARPFGTADVAHWEAEARGNTRLCMTLGVALWGKTSEDARRQLLAPHPEAPAGVDLGDLRKLLQLTAQMALMSSAASRFQRTSGMPPSILSDPLWEARREIVRRAIVRFEKR